MPTETWRHSGLIAILTVGGLIAAFSPAIAQTPAFVAPPRTIADITAILDQEKPDPVRLARENARADARPPAGAGRDALMKFYSERATSRSELGRLRDAIADIDMTIKLGGDRQDREILVARTFRSTELLNSTEYTAARAELDTIARIANRINATGFALVAYRQTIQVLIAGGDFAQAETYVGRMQTQFNASRAFPAFAEYRTRWEAEIERAKAHLAEAKGQYRAAEIGYRRSEQLIRELLSRLPPDAGRASLENRADLEVSLQGRVKARLGRLAEAEADVRRALLSRLRARGKYAVTTASHIDFLAFVLREQGRYVESEKLIRAGMEIRNALGVTSDSQSVASGLNALSFNLRLQGRHDEAVAVDAELDKAVKGWDPRRRAAFEFNIDRVHSLYASNNTEAGVKAARALLANNVARYGEKHFSSALARGFLAIGLAQAGQNAEAIAEFRKCVPMLVASGGGSDIDDSVIAALRSARVRDVVESYIGALARSDMSTELIGETLRLADAVRGQSVQQALAASSARMVTGNAALAELARRHQDLDKQVNALLGVLNNVLTMPPEDRPAAKVQGLTAEIEKLRTARAAARKEIEQRFPTYAQLIDPKPPSLEEVRGALKSGEAFLSLYLGQRESFVWAVPKEGEPMFAAIPASAHDIGLKVQGLREVLDITDLPIEKLTYDFAAAYDLYRLLMQPVEKAWRPASELVVVTNGALGLLPLVLLPTALPKDPPGGAPLFAGYRDVPWLARTHAVSMMPSAAAFATLRRLPPGPATRERLIGFGDPYFTPEQAKEAENPATTGALQVAERGGRMRLRARVATRDIDSAGLDRLPRLADTADELKSVAAALSVDAGKALHLGRDANERVVKQTDLSRYRIVAFATHGLLPGDLDGLTQPALALTAPSVAGIDGDGLLTMEEILPLKLDADWVILSACNTATGVEAGAEAISGLGRAFFYAGTRALLVTNWSVHSASARDLVADLFRRQATDARISRAQALRQAMLAVMDGPGYVENGETQYTYAHPLFWAPYSIVGDGG